MPTQRGYELDMQAFVKQRGHDVSQWLRVGGVKAFADGSLGSGSALFHQVHKQTAHLKIGYGFSLIKLSKTSVMKCSILNVQNRRTTGCVSVY